MRVDGQKRDSDNSCQEHADHAERENKLGSQAEAGSGVGRGTGVHHFLLQRVHIHQAMMSGYPRAHLR